MTRSDLASEESQSDPLVTRAWKAQQLAVKTAIERYDVLLEARRTMLQDHLAWLVSVADAPEAGLEDKLVAALDTQIAAAHDMQDRFDEREAQEQWKIFEQQ